MLGDPPTTPTRNLGHGEVLAQDDAAVRVRLPAIDLGDYDLGYNSRVGLVGSLVNLQAAFKVYLLAFVIEGFEGSVGDLLKGDTVRAFGNGAGARSAG